MGAKDRHGSRLSGRHFFWSSALMGLLPGLLLAQPSTGPDARQTASSDKLPVAQLRAVRVESQARENTLPSWDTSVDSQELETQFVQGWEDLERLLEPGVVFERSTQSINIRGLDRNRVLTTVDGVRLPWLSDGTRSVYGGLDSIAFGSLADVDIYRGADSSLAGSGALGGRVALRTLEPDDVLRPGASLGVLARTGYRSDRRETWANAAVAGRQAQSAWLLQAGTVHGHELKNQGDVGGYGNTRSEANPESARSHNVLLKWQQAVAPGHRVEAIGEWFKGVADIDVMTAQGTTYEIGHNSSRETSERKRVSLRYEFDAAAAEYAAGDALLDAASMQVYWQRQYRGDEQNAIRTLDARSRMPAHLFGPLGNPYLYPSGPYGRTNTVTQDLVGWQGEGRRDVYWGTTRHRLSALLEVYGSRVRQYAGGYDNCPAELSPIQPAGPAACSFLHTNQADTPKVDGMHWAMAVHDDILLLDDQVVLTPGMRYDSYRYEPKADAAYAANPNVAGEEMPSGNRGSAWSPSLAAAWELSPQLTLHARWAMGFLAPTAAQLYRNFGGPGTYLRIGNPDLAPERSRGFELGARWGDETLSGTVAVFDNRYRNFIDDDVSLDPAALGLDAGEYPMGITGVQNRARVRIYGAEASAQWKLTPVWRTWAALSWVVGKDQDTDSYLNSIPALRGQLGLAYERQHWGSSVTLTAAAARRKVAEPDTDFQAPGYGVVDLTAYWQPAAVRGLRLQAGVFNVFDRKYWNALNVPNGVLGQPQSALPLDYYSQPGRNFQVSVIYQY